MALKNVFLTAFLVCSMACFPDNSKQDGPSALSVYALRLGPGEEIVTSLFKFVEDKKLKAPFIITCVGSVTKATLRLAHATAQNTNEVIHLNGRFEIVSLVGTLNEMAHLHISLSDDKGKTIGGHVISDLEVFTTAEIVIGECNGMLFTREMDERTGFPELVISSGSGKVYPVNYVPFFQKGELNTLVWSMLLLLFALVY
uniref:Bifunctional protein GlmU-like n=1 Tax=Geotrypetes seraphini TaxID=260995 RepID=A0A6P8QGB0_GEOSA|nr:bifunctional protein GlmU-like [Geotrypetes seraphini]